MKYRTTGTRLGHKLFIRKRETAFDKKRHFTFSSDSLEDYKKMKGHEFADFQKRMFQQMKKDRKRRRILLLYTVIVTLLIITGFLIFWNNFDFSLWNSPEF